MKRIGIAVLVALTLAGCARHYGKSKAHGMADIPNPCSYYTPDDWFWWWWYDCDKPSSGGGGSGAGMM